jgi:hypothetical protein
MSLVLRLYLLAALSGLMVLLSPAAHALPGGIATGSCDACHAGTGEPTLSMDFEPSVVQPGDLVTLTLHIQSPGMKTAGVYIQNLDYPFLSDVNGQPTHSTGDGVTHTSPIKASADEATIQVAWTAPTEPSGTVFYVAALAANGDLSSRGDSFAVGKFDLVWGCDGITLYWDADEDAYGSEELGTSPGCAARKNWAAEKGDCNGGDASINPGATEVCNEKDDDCDGDVDEGTEPRTLYPDSDSDGFGKPGAESMLYCGSVTGYADNSDDCDDSSAEVHPGASESCNGTDDNCDGKIDEVTACGGSEPAAAPSSSSTPSLPSSANAPSPANAPSTTVPVMQPSEPVCTTPPALGTALTPPTSSTSAPMDVSAAAPSASGSNPPATASLPAATSDSAPSPSTATAPLTVDSSPIDDTTAGCGIAHPRVQPNGALSLVALYLLYRRRRRPTRH